MRALLIGLVLLLLVPCRVLAQPPPATTAPALTAAQARAALDVLNDPKKRAEITTTLEAIAKAQPAPAAPAPGAAAANPAAGAAQTGLQIPLAPNSLGAQVLVGAESFLNRISADATNATQAMQSLPLLWGWIVVMATAPWAREILLDVAWRAAVALLCGLAAEFALRFLLRRPIAALEALAPAAGGRSAAGGTAAETAPAEHDEADSDEAGPSEDAADEEPQDAAAAPTFGPPPAPDNAVARAEAGDIEPPLRRHRGLPAEVLLRRVPLVLARLLLDLIPVLGFLVAGHVVTASAIGGQASARLVMLAVVDSYALCIALLGVARMLLSPRASRLRLFRLPDTLATYLMHWTRRLIVIAVFGYVIAEVGLLLGLTDVAYEGLQKTTGFVLHTCLAIIVLQKRRAVRRRLRAPPGATGPTARMRNALASVWHWIALFFIVAIWLVWAVEIRDGFTRLLHFCIVTAVLLIGARLVLILLDGSLDRALSVPPETAVRYPGLEARLRLYHPALSALLRAIVYLLGALALLQLYGFGALTWFGESELGQRIASALGTLTVTLLLAFAGWEAANAAIQRHLAKLAKEQQVARSARLRTLLPLLRSALLITILVFAGLTVLSEIGINIAPLLAGAGIIGVAVGFGSQKLVQDFITGIFLLLENAMQVGDTVTVGGLTGTVENLSVRTIRLRAGDGSMYIIPFSAVTTVTNANRGLGNAPISVTVDYDEDTDRVAAVLTEIVAGMRADPGFGGKMLSDLQLWGVDKVDGAEATIVGQMVCTDSGRWSVQREFNRRMKKRFQELGIRLYNPMRSIAVTLPPMGPPAGGPPAGAAAAEQSPGPAGKEQAHEQARAAD
jgi:small-conductance mechanosensitive channel